MAAKPASAGKHGGGHKDRHRATPTGRKDAAKQTDAKLKAQGKNTDGSKGKPSGRGGW